jgi:hypothetical protein
MAILGWAAKNSLRSTAGMFMPDPDFCTSLSPDPKTAAKERSVKNLLSYLFGSVVEPEP